MTTTREVFVKITALDNSSKSINVIAEALKRLQKEINKPVSDSTDKTASYKSASYNSALKDIERMRAENLRREKIVAAEITRTDALLANNRIRESKRAANAVISTLTQMQRESEKSAKSSSGIFGSVLSGSFFGTLGARAVSAFTSAISGLPSVIADIFQRSADFTQATVLLAQFSGSVANAQTKIQELIQVAGATPGLSFSSAVDGQKRLQAIGFEGDKATEILKGLANIRVLSGSTKADYDAVILNLTQIASGGQKVGQEIRELIGRMPAFANVIRKEFGTLSGEVLNKLDPQEFVSRLATAAASMNVQFASSSLAAENLSDSINRIKIVVGSIIEQNPEVIALLRLWASEIDGVSSSLANQDSQQRATFTSFTSRLAKGLVDAENFVDKVSTYFQIFQNRLSVGTENFANILGNNVVITMEMLKTLAYGATSVIATGVDIVTNGVQKAINAVVNQLNAVTFNIPGIPQLPVFDTVSNFAAEMRKETADAFEKTLISTKLLFSNIQSGLQKNAETAKVNNQLFGNLQSRTLTRDVNYLKLVEQERKAVLDLRNKTFEKTGFGKTSNADSGGRKGGGRLSSAGLTGFASDRDFALYQKALRNLSPNLRAQILDYAEQYGIPSSLAMAQIFSESSFNTKAVSPFNKNVGQNAFGLTQVLPSTASNLLKRKVSGEELKNPTTALTAYGIYMNKLFAEFGDYELAAFAYHNGEGAARKFAAALDSGDKKRINAFAKANPKGIAYAKKISALSGLSKDEQFGVVDLAKQSDAATKAERQKTLDQALYFYKQFGLIPTGELLNDFQQMFAEEAKKAGTAQKTKEDIVNEFRQNAFNRGGTLPEPTGATISTNITTQKTEDELYIDALRESLGVNEKITDNILRRRNFLAEISELYYSSIVDQESEAFDIAERRALLAKQNADSVFVANRRKNLADSEAGSLEQRISDLQDILANGDVNKSLEIQEAYLQDVLSLRQREVDAVKEINRLQLELSQKGIFSQNQSDAKVLDYLNGQIKSVSETFADFRIGIAGTYIDAITSPFDALEKKLEGLNPIVRGLAQTFLDLGRDIVKAFSQKIIMQLLGLGGTGNANQSGGFLSGILGGIGGLFGNRGGTPSFNPNAGGVGSLPSFGGGSSSLAGVPRGNPVAALAAQFGGQSNGGSTGFSSIFGAQGFGNNVGTYGAIGAGAGLLGGLVGGRVGGFISGAGSGLALGATIGSIIPGLGTALGAGIGAAVGGLISLVGGDPKRKADKKENMPAYQERLSEAFKSLNQILVDSDALKFSPPENANTEAAKIYEGFSNFFGVTFQSKKYRAEAEKLNAVKKKEAEKIIEQIKLSVINAKSYGADAASLVPVFAKGNFFGRDSQMLDMAKAAKRPLGYIAGGQLGVDRHLGLFADGEAIINRQHQYNINRLAGFNVLAEAGIPNFPKYAEGNYFGNTANVSAAPAAKQPIYVTIVVESEVIASKIKEIQIDGLNNDVEVQRATITTVDRARGLRRNA